MAFFQFLFVHETVHLIASAVIALLLWKVYSNRWVIAISLIAGLLIDIDHLFDYVIDYPRVVGPIFDLSKITLYDYMSSAGKVYVLFIAWILSGSGGLSAVFKLQTQSQRYRMGFDSPHCSTYLCRLCVLHASPIRLFLLFRIFHNFSQDRFNGG